MPYRILQREIEGLLASYGGLIQRRTTSLDANCNVDQLFADGFEAVLIAAGLSQTSAGLRCRRPKTGVEGAMEFLARTKKGACIQGTVQVLGGGNTAIDAALAAKRAGAEEVSLVYRRSFAEMPAWPQERDQALREGIYLVTLTAPLEYLADANDRLTGLKVVRTRLGAKDASGRRQPVPIPGSEHAGECVEHSFLAWKMR